MIVGILIDIVFEVLFVGCLDCGVLVMLKVMIMLVDVFGDIEFFVFLVMNGDIIFGMVKFFKGIVMLIVWNLVLGFYYLIVMYKFGVKIYNVFMLLEVVYVVVKFVLLIVFVGVRIVGVLRVVFWLICGFLFWNVIGCIYLWLWDGVLVFGWMVVIYVPVVVDVGYFL